MQSVLLGIVELSESVIVFGFLSLVGRSCRVVVLSSPGCDSTFSTGGQGEALSAGNRERTAALESEGQRCLFC